MLQLLKLPPVACAFGKPSAASGCVVPPAPTIVQALVLSHCGEQLGITELIPEPAVERFGKTPLPGGSWLDVVRSGAAALATTLERVGNELMPVVTADIGRCRLEAG